MAEKVEDLNIPLSSVRKILNEALPKNTTVTKEAALAISKAASVFVLYSASFCGANAQQYKRKILNAQDVFKAMKEMGEFEHFNKTLKEIHEGRKEAAKTKKEANKMKKKMSASPALTKQNSLFAAGKTNKKPQTPEPQSASKSSTQEPEVMVVE